MIRNILILFFIGITILGLLGAERCTVVPNSSCCEIPLSEDGYDVMESQQVESESILSFSEASFSYSNTLIRLKYRPSKNRLPIGTNSVKGLSANLLDRISSFSLSVARNCGWMFPSRNVLHYLFLHNLRI